MASDYERATGRWTSASRSDRAGTAPERYREAPFDAGTSDARPRFGIGSDELDALQERERVRRRRFIYGGSAVAGIGALALVIGLVLGGGGGGGDTTELLSRGVLLQNAGRLDEAADIYHQVIDAEPENKIAYFNLGVIDQTQGQNQEAAANYVQVLSIDPVYVPALFNLAILREDEGDTQGALGLYRRVIAADPENAAAMLNLGILMLESGDEAEATDMISRAVEMDPSMQQMEEPTPAGAADPESTTPTSAPSTSTP